MVLARLYFHLHDGVDTLVDREGADMPVEQAATRALAEARALIAAEALHGRIDLGQAIEVKDDAGRRLYCLAFAEAVEIVAPH